MKFINDKYKTSMKFYKRKIFWFILLIILILIVYFVFIRSSENEIEFSSNTVEKTDLLQTVIESGKVVSDPRIDLKFLTSGKVEEVFFDVGDQVQKEDILAKLDSTAQQLTANQNLALLNAAKAAYNLKLAGAKDEDIKISSVAVDSAMVDLERAELSLKKIKKTTQEDIKAAELSVKDAEIKLSRGSSDDYNTDVQNAYDNMRITLVSQINHVYDSLESADEILGVDNRSGNDIFEKYLSVKNLTLLPNAQNKYVSVKDKYNKLYPTVQALNINSSFDNIDFALDAMLILESELEELLDSTRETLDNSISGTGFSETTIDSYKTTINSLRTVTTTNLTTLENYSSAIDTAKKSYNTTLNAVDIAKQNLNSIKINSEELIKESELAVKAKQALLDQAQASLKLKLSKPRDVDLAGFEADIKKAQSLYDAALYELSKTEIISPIEGTIGEIYFKVGEVITSAQNFLTLISNQMHIEVDISESDIAKIEIGDNAEMTLDAYGEDTRFQAEVISIDPIETDISGVIYYKVNLVFNETNGKSIKPGMTVNIIIETDRKNDVLVIPQRAITKKGSKEYVNLVKRKGEKVELKEVEITTGLLGDNGIIEVTSGLKEGQEIVTFIKDDQLNLF